MIRRRFRQSHNGALTRARFNFSVTIDTYACDSFSESPCAVFCATPPPCLARWNQGVSFGGTAQHNHTQLTLSDAMWVKMQSEGNTKSPSCNTGRLHMQDGMSHQRQSGDNPTDEGRGRNTGLGTIQQLYREAIAGTDVPPAVNER